MPVTDRRESLQRALITLSARERLAVLYRIALALGRLGWRWSPARAVHSKAALTAACRDPDRSGRARLPDLVRPRRA